ncbi:hypothetical protein [Thermogemmatispora sp.]|uniref:hypothetical protein n=1 Tax=Thermogemmatispora sp. TaxID=1968838 RepID=UPI002ACBE002|nr:hypothetical protein [Thermogemmatispora sp.]
MRHRLEKNYSRGHGLKAPALLMLLSGDEVATISKHLATFQAMPRHRCQAQGVSWGTST